MTKGVKINYSKQELSFIESNCMLPITELHDALCKNFNRDDVRAINLNALRKRNGWSTGRTGFFVKGQVPFNKGVKGWYAKGTEDTRFKKGSVPPNYRPVGTIRIVDGYQEIKVAEGMRQWKQLHRVIWERLNGQIPKGCNLIFLDGKCSNISIANLSVMTKADNMRRNSVHNYPKEIAILIQLRGQINRQINKKEKQNEQHQHA